ncbi:MAG TPA: hypothetical protein PK007_00070 [Candidatus Kapabacteria bacterium]|nr:hypothetical protein [Candidatus Kapabacteria bacterium]
MKNAIKYILTIGVAGLLVLVGLLLLAPAFAAWGEALAVVAAFVSVFVAFDRYVMKDIDTVKELREGNLAYAVFLVAVALLVLAAAVLVG